MARRHGAESLSRPRDPGAARAGSAGRRRGAGDRGAPRAGVRPPRSPRASRPSRRGGTARGPSVARAARAPGRGASPARPRATRAPERRSRRGVRLREVGVREESEEKVRVGRVPERLAEAQLGVRERGWSCRTAARIASWSGRDVWTATMPGRSPRPTRPAACVTSWNVRSAERKSGKERSASASSTASAVAFGKSCPLATICVPRSACARPASKSIRTPAAPPRRAAASRSRTAYGDSRETLREALGEALGAEADRLSVRTRSDGHAAGRRITSPQ